MENNLNSKQAAEYLSTHGFRISSASLSVRRHRGWPYGPRFTKAGEAQSSRVFYSTQDLDEWMAEYKTRFSSYNLCRYAAGTGP